MKPMKYTDIAIVGGGLAGSTAAAMLGRAGIAAVLIDPHTIYPPELRCEKLGGEQLDLLRKTGGCDVARDHARRRGVGSALWPPIGTQPPRHGPASGLGCGG